jgi:FkbM family methyltransferase
VHEELTTWQMTTPRGAPVTFTVRNGTSDGSLAYSTMGGPMGYVPIDEYDLRDRHLSGWALDIGAHIGCIAIPLAIDNPDLRVVAVECLPANCDLLRRNVADNDLGERVIVVEAAAGGPDEVSRTCWYGFGDHPSTDPGYAPAQRYIGNTFYEDVKGGRMTGETVEMPVVSLPALLDRFGIDEVRFLKTDAEGAEWAFLDTPAVERVAEMIGEYHGDYAGQAADAVRTSPVTGPTGPIGDGQAEMRRLLERTHVVTFDTPYPTTGIFRATRR